MSRQPHLWRVLPLIGLIAAAGCQARRPDFMTRVRQDCAGGDKWSCDLIDALNQPPPAEVHDSEELSAGR
jgi:hypothetical protein